MKPFDHFVATASSIFLFTMASAYSEPSKAEACSPSPNPPYKQDGQVPTKIIKIYNNDPVATIYPLIETSTNSVDEWLQAYFGVCDSNQFKHVSTYRVYVNELSGVPAGGFVALKVPLYTKLTVDADPVFGQDKYINWWNGGRVKIYDSTITYAEDYQNDKTNKVNLKAGSVGISCADVPGSVCSSVDIYAGTVALGDATPSQLTEYTFAGAPLQSGGNGLRIWAVQDVDWDVSYVDSVYMPIAMGVMGNRYIGYTGTVKPRSDFSDSIRGFVSKSDGAGFNWSHYLIPGDTGNAIAKLPGTYNYIRGIFNKTNTISTSEKDSPLTNMALLWKSCFQAGSPEPGFYDFPFLDGLPLVSCSGPMQKDLWKVHKFFRQNFNQYKGDSSCDSGHFINDLNAQNVSISQETLARIYGWVPFNDYCVEKSAANSLCKTSSNPKDAAILDPNKNICSDEYKTTHKLYRDLEYSYTRNKYGPADVQHTFNPYVQLIHGANFLGMNGYAFSIDDAVGNMQESGSGLIIAVGGTRGLENKKAYNPKAAITVSMGSPGPNSPIWKKFDACNAAIQCEPRSDLLNGATNFKLGTISKFPIKVVIKDSADRRYEFIVKAGPSKANGFKIPADAVTGCKVTDANGNSIVSTWCVPYTEQGHGTPYAHSGTDENNNPVNYISADPPSALTP